MTTRTVTIDLKTILDTGWAYGTVSFEMVTDVATSGASIYPQSLKKVQTDSDGVGSVDLAVPDSGAWIYEVRLPSTQESQIVVSAGATVTLAELLTAGITPIPPSGDQYWVRLDGSNAQTGRFPQWRFWIQPQTIESGETIIIPDDYQMVVHGGLSIVAGGILIVEAGGVLITPA